MFVPRYQHSVPCKPRLSLLSPASPASVCRTSTRTRLSALSGLRTYLSCIHLGYLTHERSHQRCSPETIAYTAVDSGRRSGERERGTPPFILGLGRTSGCRSHLCPLWGPTRVILLDSEAMGVRAAGGPIMNAIRYLTNHTATIALCRVPGPRAICKEPTLRTSKFSGRAHSYPRTSLCITLNPSLSIDYCTCALPKCSTPHVEKTSRSTATVTFGSIGTYSIDIGPAGDVRRRGLVTLLTSTFSYGVNLSCFL